MRICQMLLNIQHKPIKTRSERVQGKHTGRQNTMGITMQVENYSEKSKAEGGSTSQVIQIQCLAPLSAFSLERQMYSIIRI